MAFFMNIRDYQNRLNLRKNRIFRDKLHPLDAYDDTEILRRYFIYKHNICVRNSLPVEDDASDNEMNDDANERALKTMHCNNIMHKMRHMDLYCAEIW